jgi:hypothetical protein
MAHSISDVMTAHPITHTAASSVVEAARAIRDSDIGGVIVQGGKPVCLVSLGDLALTQDPHSALGNISAAPANR